VTPPPTWLFFPAAAAPWLPSDLTNLIAWYKADAISGLSNNDPVSTWSDSSTSGWNATASSGSRPTYITAAQNSLPIVRFSGSNHLNLGSRDLFRNVGGGTIYAVTKDAAITTIGQVFHGPTSSGIVRLGLQSGGVGSGNNDKFRAVGRRLDADSGLDAVSTGQVTTNWTLLGCVADWTGSVLTQYVNAGVDGQNTSWHSGGNTSNTASSSGNTCIGATFTNNSNAFNGDIAEIVVVHEALSTGDRQKLEGYLAHKWGLTGNLPGASPGPEHPYKTSPP
jgi:hypothetical protein